MAIVRGLKGAELLYLVDGMRLNSAFFSTAPSQHVAQNDPLSVDRIEWVRGPAASAYGSDAMGGVIHVSTRERRFDANDWRTRGDASLAYGTGDLARRARLAGAVGRRDMSLAIRARRRVFRMARRRGNSVCTPA
jgi:outer membrane cobalamin receptor